MLILQIKVSPSVRKLLNFDSRGNCSFYNRQPMINDLGADLVVDSERETERVEPGAEVRAGRRRADRDRAVAKAAAHCQARPSLVAAA